MAHALQIDIERRYPGGPTVRARLDPLLPGSTTVLFGPSGAGKSTVLRCVAGLDRPDAGRVSYGSQLWSEGAVFLPPQARRVGYLFQDYALFPHLTVAQNVGYGLREASRRAAVVPQLLERFGLSGLADRRPTQLSGGQAQRVALARALAPDPTVLLLDEPLSALDVQTRSALRRELRGLLTQVDFPTIIVTHDRAEAAALGDRLVLLARGQVLQQGRTAELFQQPNSAASARVLGIENVWERAEEPEKHAVGALLSGDRSPPDLICLHAEELELCPTGGVLRGSIRTLELEGPLVRVVVEVDGVEVVVRDRAAGWTVGEQVGLRRVGARRDT
jgi:molybdate transport system ATP-binding protein